ncbi:La protein-like protein [Phlyctema vagabunda]|uniref:La protein-like protein n=1 Tax=Phlyctema vagabunda TaxID=108571 RepID=A0ABR4P4T1_9HELO
MSNIPVETIEPDPAATSIGNDETVNSEAVAAPAQADSTTDKDAEAKKENGSEEKIVAKDGETNGSSESKVIRSTYEERKAEKNNRANYRNESKFDPSVLPETDDPTKIRGQVEFYFSDSNLATDQFMGDLTGGSLNKGVPIAKLHSFKRMQRFQPYSAVVAALRDSIFLVVNGPEGSEEVKRKTAYDASARAGGRVESRSIYVKGFGDEEPTTQFDIEAFFAPYGPTNSVRLRRTDDKLFKGSVFVEFADDALAQKFLDLEPKPLWQGKHVLEIKSKNAYVEQKRQDIRDGKMEPNETRKSGRGGARGRGGRGGRGGDRRGDRDPDDWKKRREDDQKSGFKDRRGGRGGRGRGGRGRDRDDRGSRNDESKAEAKTESSTENEKKRPREDEAGAAEEPAAKKVDTKPEVAATEA